MSRDVKLFLFASGIEALGIVLWFLPVIGLIIVGIGALFLVIALANFALPFLHWLTERKMQTHQCKIETRTLSYQHRIEEKKLAHTMYLEKERLRMQQWTLAYAQQIGGQIKMHGESVEVLTSSVRIEEIRQDQKQEQKLLGTPQPVAPPFASIKSQIRPGHLILGYSAQGPIPGDVPDLLSMIFAGKPGTGKSTGLLYYLAILLLAGASVYVFDPQGSLSELSEFIPYYGEFSQFEPAVAAIYREILEREELWRHGKQVRKPLLVLVDELPAIARMEQKAKALQYSVLDLAEKIVLENRKHNVYCMLTGQSMPAEVLPTLTRDNCSSRLIFNTSDAHARMAGLDPDSRKKLLPLLRKAQPGTAILDVSRRPEPDIVALPYTTVDDLSSIIRGVPPNASPYGGEPMEATWEDSPYSPEIGMGSRQSTIVTGVLVDEVNQPPKPTEANGKDYRFTEDERPVVVELYKAHGSIDKVLRQMKKSNRYHPDASRIIREEGA